MCVCVCFFFGLLHSVTDTADKQEHTNCMNVGKFEKRARSLLVVVGTPPTKDFKNFTQEVLEYNKKQPFNFTVPPIFAESDWSKVG